MNETRLRTLIQSPTTEVTETLVDFVAKTTIKHPFAASCDDWIAATYEIPSRDKFELFFSISADRKTTDGSAASLDEVARFLKEYGDESEVEVKLHINKKITHNKASIYSIEKYSEFIEKTSLTDFLASISHIFNEHLCFEVFSNIKSFGSKTIKFHPANNLQQAQSITGTQDSSSRHRKILLFKENCLVSCPPFSLANLTPSDFHLDQSTPFAAIEKKFQAACSTLALTFLANNTDCTPDGLFSYRFYGYKAVDYEKVDPDELAKSFELIHQIYDWAYEGGNRADKLGLVRNIVSIHLDAQGKPRFDKQMKDAIWSNYQIYLKENVQSYLDIKNKIGELLVEFIGRTSSISDDLLTSLKSNVAIIVTFLLTVVVVNGLKDNGESVIFSNIYLGIVFIITTISGLWLDFLKKNVVMRFDSAAKAIEATILANYNRVLLQAEIKESVDPAITANKSSLEKEVTSYSRLWHTLLLIFLLLYFIGNAVYVEKSVFSIVTDYIVRVFDFFGKLSP